MVIALLADVLEYGSGFCASLVYLLSGVHCNTQKVNDLGFSYLCMLHEVSLLSCVTIHSIGCWN